MAHISVLEKEAVASLNLNHNSVVVDCTIGAGGYAKAILKELGPGGTYVGFDIDQTALTAVADTIEGEATVHLVCSNFRQLTAELEKLQLIPTAIVADLGWRSEQFEGGQKGFSFNYDEPLLMTYGDPAGYEFTAYDIVNDWEEASIADVIFGYGEERAARRIAAAIVATRETAPIKTSGQLAEIVKNAVPVFRNRLRIHPATQTFQALRIAVNDELGALEQLMEDATTALAPGGRLAIVTFHSLEDRLVKRFMKQTTHDQVTTKVTKKPVRASEEELTHNPRARSAKLRVIEKI